MEEDYENPHDRSFWTVIWTRNFIVTKHWCKFGRGFPHKWRYTLENVNQLHVLNVPLQNFIKSI